jgi:hypothetical protein
VETLETLPPFSKPEDDAYRLYNIGVGDEALGYKAETPASARKYFEQAVVQYRKAGEANPKEKYFIPPVNRIETALEHYRALEQPARPISEPLPAVSVAPPAPPTAPAAAPAARVPAAAAPAIPPAGRVAAAASTWRLTEIINNVPVVWDVIAGADLTFRGTMGAATVATGTWQYDTAKRSFDLTGYNLVLKVPFTCAFSLSSPQARGMNGVCLDQAGTKYKTDGVRQ